MIQIFTFRLPLNLLLYHSSTSDAVRISLSDGRPKNTEPFSNNDVLSPANAPFHFLTVFLEIAVTALSLAVNNVMRQEA